MRIDVSMTRHFVYGFSAIENENAIYITATGIAVIEHDEEHPKMWCMHGRIDKTNNSYDWNFTHHTSIPEDGIKYIAYHLYDRTMNCDEVIRVY